MPRGEEKQRTQTMLVVSLPQGREGESLKRELQARARKDDRSVSSYIFRILRDHLKGDKKV